MTDNPKPEPVNVMYPTPEATEPSTAPAPTEAEDVTTPAAETGPQGEELQPEETGATEVIEASAESEESDTSGQETTDDTDSDLYLDLDGKETALSEVRKWRDGHMMQEDYTRKTMALSDERKAFEADSKAQREQLAQDQAKVADMTAQLEVLVAEDGAIDWDQLKLDDPDKFIELKERAEKRQAKLEEIKAERQQPQADPAFVREEQKRLFEAYPEWLDKDGKPTDKMLADQKLFTEYASKAGFSIEEQQAMFQKHHLETVLKAAKWDALQAKKQEVIREKAKAPIVRKSTPKTDPTQRKRDAVSVMYGNS